LIIPIIDIMIEMVSRKQPYILSASIFLLFDLLTIILLILAAKIQMEVFNAIIPLFAYSILFIYIWTLKRDTIYSANNTLPKTGAVNND